MCRSVLVVINRNPTDQRESQSERDTVTKDTVHNVSRPPPLRVVLCGVVCGEEVGSVAASGLAEQPSAEDLVSIAIKRVVPWPLLRKDNTQVEGDDATREKIQIHII